MTVWLVSKKEAFSGVLGIEFGHVLSSTTSLQTTGDCGIDSGVGVGESGQVVVRLAVVITWAGAVSTTWSVFSAGLEGCFLTGLVQTSNCQPVCSLILPHISSRDLRSVSFPCSRNHHLSFPNLPGCVFRFTCISLTEPRLETVETVFLTTLVVAERRVPPNPSYPTYRFSLWFFGRFTIYGSSAVLALLASDCDCGIRKIRGRSVEAAWRRGHRTAVAYE